MALDVGPVVAAVRALRHPVELPVAEARRHVADGVEANGRVRALAPVCPQLQCQHAGTMQSVEIIY